MRINAIEIKVWTREKLLKFSPFSPISSLYDKGNQLLGHFVKFIGLSSGPCPEYLFPFRSPYRLSLSSTHFQEFFFKEAFTDSLHLFKGRPPRTNSNIPPSLMLFGHSCYSMFYLPNVPGNTSVSLFTSIPRIRYSLYFH